MCGFISLHHNNNIEDYSYSTAVKMLDSIKHRGPDGDKIEVFSRAVQGHCRLSIIDVSSPNQPLVTADNRYSLVFNGEIYNYLELRDELITAGVRFKTKSDTEVLFQLLLNQGEEAINKLNGMFAFVFYDHKTNCWIAARDRNGIKPLYLWQITDSELGFASEIKAFTKHHKFVRQIDRSALNEYFTFQYCLEDRTLFQCVKRVRPGYYLKGNGGQVRSEVRYWQNSYEIDKDHNEDWFVSRLTELVENAVGMQMRSDVPVGGYLSGGLDSSLVCAMAKKHHDGNFKTFHGRFVEGHEFDESYYAKKLAKHSGLDYLEVVPSAEDFVEYMPKLIKALDEPVAGPGVFPQFAVSRLASEHVKVVLGGQGGDEIFAGYARYLVAYLEQAIKGAINETVEEKQHVVALSTIIPNLPILKQYIPMLKSFMSNNAFGSFDERYYALLNRSEGIKHLLTDDFKNELENGNQFSVFKEEFNSSDTASYINKMLDFDQKYSLPALLQVEDRVSMAASIESRVPFLDHRISEFSAKVPPGFKFKGGMTKALLKKAVSEIVPNEILLRKDKMGFPVPLNRWLEKGVVRDFVSDTLNSSKALERGFFKRSVLKEMVDLTGISAREIWGALCLELWHLEFIDDNA
ncbi:Asparagine synthetase glutamine-hydrolyzing 1 [Rhodobacteraceae bacterium SB2]|nr:Asparagine synthetase glutamine-hydrolyzing 1 [Rhodobacteraceae bacterium SB2]